MDSRQKLVIADRDLAWSLPLRKRLAERGYSIQAVSSARELLECVGRSQPDLIILGDRLDELGGRVLGSLLEERSPRTRIIRVLPAVTSGVDEDQGSADNVLFSVTRSTPAEDMAGAIARVLGGAPRERAAARLPLVVCVDDDVLFVRSLARTLRRQGYRVLTYTEPELALEELAVVKPDLVILDILMPGMSGLEVLGEIRRFHPASLPVLLLSSLEGDGRMEEGRRRGAASYLAKPCPPEILLETVRRLLASRVLLPQGRGAGKTGSRRRSP